MEPYIFINKPEGITPIEFWKKYRKEQGMSDTKGGICGKLDPMATGQLLILLGENCKDTSDYRNKDKVYEFDVCIGLSTDTDDILGILKGEVNDEVNEVIDSIVKKFLDYRNVKVQRFHDYSAINVEGIQDNGDLVKKPMWWWSQRNWQSRINPPCKSVKIYDMEYLGLVSIPLKDYLETTLKRLSNVSIDPERFRLRKIKREWEYLLRAPLDMQKHTECLEDYEKKIFLNVEVTILKFRTKVSTGTYIRQIVREIKDELAIPLLCDRIHRKEIILN